MRKTLLKTFFCMGILGALPLSALQQIDMDAAKAPEIEISHEDLNRITVKEGAIVDIVSDETKIQATLHQNTGAAFVTCLRPLETPTSISVTTGVGEIQTLIATTKSGAGELIVLKPSLKNSSEEISLTTDFHGRTIRLLDAVLEGKTPSGYGEREVADIDLLGVPEPLSSKSKKAFVGPFETVFLFEITNPSRRKASLFPSHLQRKGDLWVFLPKKTIHPGETVPCIIATKKED